jgi:Phosphoinositide phospholipase C, Ca2+-dependent
MRGTAGMHLITPAMIKGDAPNLRTAVLQKGWPLLDNVRGKIMFVLDSPDEITKRYQASGRDRPLFVNVPESDSEAAFFIMNETIAQQDQIRALVKKGFMVRTRADAETREARSSDYRRWEAAKNSGAQLISTDYYRANLSPDGRFEISFPISSYSRCNPVNYFSDCPPSLR